MCVCVCLFAVHTYVCGDKGPISGDILQLSSTSLFETGLSLAQGLQIKLNWVVNLRALPGFCITSTGLEMLTNVPDFLNVGFYS